MGQILQFIRPYDVFDSETLTILSDAFDKTVASLEDHGQPLIVRETMAIPIFHLAAKGERDPDRLYRAALGSYEKIRKPLVPKRPSQERRRTKTLAPQLQPIPLLARPFAFASLIRDFLGTTFYIHIFGVRNLMIPRSLFEPSAEF
jgi:hypothetical protein